MSTKSSAWHVGVIFPPIDDPTRRPSLSTAIDILQAFELDLGVLQLDCRPPSSSSSPASSQSVLPTCSWFRPTPGSDNSGLLQLMINTQRWVSSIGAQLSVPSASSSSSAVSSCDKLANELAMCSYLGINIVILPHPAHSSTDCCEKGEGESSLDSGVAAVLARHIVQNEEQGQGICKLWIQCPVYLADTPQGGRGDDYVQRNLTVWNRFDKLRNAVINAIVRHVESADDDQKEEREEADDFPLLKARAELMVAKFLFPVLEVSQLPEEGSGDRQPSSKARDNFPSHWLGENVGAISLDCTTSTLETLRRETTKGKEAWSCSDHAMCSFVGTFLKRRCSCLIRLPDDESMDSALDDTLVPLCLGLEKLVLNHCIDARRDEFRDYEDVVQLPLQPLKDNLSNLVYSVFEADRPKYDHYRHALRVEIVRAAQAKENSRRKRRKEHQVSAGADAEDEVTVVTVAVLGAGRGPLVDCAIEAFRQQEKEEGQETATRLRIVIIEKNPHACQLLKLRLLCDPLWNDALTTPRQRCCVALVHGDGRTPLQELMRQLEETTEGAEEQTVCFCSRFGEQQRNCWRKKEGEGEGESLDIVVSELLGSFGCNELSPECIEGFFKAARMSDAAITLPPLSPSPSQQPQRKGILASTVSIPHSYTSFVAPCFAQAAISWVRHHLVTTTTASAATTTTRSGENEKRQLRVRHRMYHTPFVTNLCRYLNLADAKPCFTFLHNESFCLDSSGGGGTRAVAEFERRSDLAFTVLHDGYLTSLSGYFSSVLSDASTSRNSDCDLGAAAAAAAAAVEISTLPSAHTDAMYSWFPILFPLEESVRVFPNDEVRISMARKSSTSAVVDAAAVWYEWSVQVLRGTTTGTTTTPAVIVWESGVMNRDGWAYKVKL